MKKVLTIVFILINLNGFCQTPVIMASQNNYTYIENFSDINNWVFNTTTNNGTFINGLGASAWKGIDVATTTPSIPNATRITTLSNSFQTPNSSGGVPIFSGGLYKGNHSIVMLSTGPTNNTSSIGFDFFMDFTGVNAGTLSFDWASLNNNSGNRAGSLRVYASTDGISYTEITAAQVLNFINFSPTSGSITNISLPSYFSGSATARLRFYYHNGTGGNSGSRPRINIDNVKVTALPTANCISPTAQPTNFILTNVLHNTVSLSFTAANPAPQNYLVVMSKNNSLSSNPVNLTSYNIDDNLGDGTVVAITNTTSATISNLTNSTTYYFFIFAMNNVCTGGPLYNWVSPLTGSATTLAGQLPCAAPTTQPLNLVFTNITTSSISASFSPIATANEYLIIRSTSPNFTGTLNNGTFYNGGNFLGNGSVVTRTTGNTFTANNLLSGVTYYFFVFAMSSQNCNNPPAYNSVNPLTNSATTVALPNCIAPTSQPNQLQLNATSSTVNGFFQATSQADGYIVLRSTNAILASLPVNGSTYAVGSNLGSATVVANTNATAFFDDSLLPNTTYYYFVMARNINCVGTSPIYLTQNILTNSIQTTSSNAFKHYYGNLHAHSSYSDGNKDSLTAIPVNNYAYAKNSLCMDFLGISDHNHSLAGMQLPFYALGLKQADTSSSNDFLALYGMEYGVISNGGHVLIYGSDSLIGWEQGNYDVFVQRSDYLGTEETTGNNGLFRTLNQLRKKGKNVFATLAHPDFSDYNNLLNLSYNAMADSAIVGSAVASGPAFSEDTAYNDPPSSYEYLDYYIRMLSKGYHLGPLMDHDTHYTNFGRSQNNRLAVISKSLSKADFFDALNNRSFFASEDCDTKVHFNINNQPMGSSITSSLSPAIAINAIDPTSANTTTSIKLMYGIVGSGILPIQIASTNSNTLLFTDVQLANNVNAYYYADITIAGKRTVTSPIWYSKTNPLPLVLTNYSVYAIGSSIKNLWTTKNEINVSHYIIERSYDGNNFEQIAKILAHNNTNNDYSFIDNNAFEKMNDGFVFYRLVSIDKDNSKSYSSIRKLALNQENNLLVFPNPSKGTINIKSQNIKEIAIVNSLGQVIKKINNTHTSTLINIDLPKGFYYIKSTFNNNKNLNKTVIVE